jgi:hypothetical protein
MSVARESDVEEALRAIRRPIVAAPMPPAELAVRVRTAPIVRRLVPPALAVRMGEQRGARNWEHLPEQRAYATASMEVIVGGTARAGEAEMLARRHLIEEKADQALYWAPWSPVRLSESSLENLRAALAEGRGVLLSACHFGPVYNATSVGASLRRPVFTLVGDWLTTTEPEASYWGRRVVRRQAGLRDNDARMIPAAGSFPIVCELLAQGEVVLVNFDVRGVQRTRFLGKPVALRTGTVKLAAASGAPVVPVRTLRRGVRISLEAAEPLDPRAYADPMRLHEELARIHEHWILEYPEALEDPLRPGAWEDATAAEWPPRAEEG